MSETENVLTASGELLLDPFVYQPGKASAIEGLGGSERHHDPAYAFHTDYVHAAEGPCQFTVRFQGLSARLGTLQFRVHMLVEDDNGRLMLGNSLRIQFNRLIQLGSEVSIRFDGYRRVRYALYATILGEHDARADAVTVTLDRPATPDAEAPAEGVAELRNSGYGQGTTRPVPLMVSVAAPTLAHPVSQVASLAQAGERAYAEQCARLGRNAEPSRTGWAAAYVLQSLGAYGVLGSGAQGLGFGGDADALAAAVCEMGASATTRPLPERADDLPAGLVNFDFLWTVDALPGCGFDETFAYLEGMLRCLRPGGLAVHVLPFRPSVDQRGGEDWPGVLQRKDVERIALLMIARNVETAQIKIAGADPILGDVPGGPAGVGAFGLVFRRPLLTGP